jgi:RNA polymerase-binding transcription factor DksA
LEAKSKGEKMNQTWEVEITNKYPKTFARLSYFECSGGWKDLIAEIAEVSEKYNNTQVNSDYHITAAQVKEKFGGLRFYIDSGEECPHEVYLEISNLIAEVENRSYKTCEVCGEEAQKRRERSWVKTLCDKHA